jgi:hypothetical protein
MSASLIGRLWSSAFRPSTAAVSMSLAGSCFSTGSAPAEIDVVFEAIARDQIPALIVAVDPFFDTRSDQLIALAAQRRVPVMYQFRQYPAAGGLMSYGPDLLDAYRQAGVYVGRVLKGAKLAELPAITATALLRFWDMACSFVFRAPCQIRHWRGRARPDHSISGQWATFSNVTEHRLKHIRCRRVSGWGVPRRRLAHGAPDTGIWCMA